VSGGRQVVCYVVTESFRLLLIGERKKRINVK